MFAYRGKMRFSQQRGKWAVFVALCALLPASADASCENSKALEAAICTVDPAKEDLRLFWRDPKGQPFGLFGRLADALAATGRTLSFAMNAGMFQPDLSPVGLFVEEGQQRRPANLRASGGNFGMRPNGVFWLDGRARRRNRDVAVRGIGPAARLCDAVRAAARHPGGRLHPKIRADGTSAKIRNGVGVCEDGRVRFVITDAPVTFYAFATLFRDTLKCPDALYLDGSISALYSPALRRNDGWRAMGPMLGVVEK